jgi:PHF5-like protein
LRLTQAWPDSHLPLLIFIMSKHHPDLIMCHKQPGTTIGRLCEKCEGKCVMCDSLVRQTTAARICDECNYGSFQVRFFAHPAQRLRGLRVVQTAMAREAQLYVRGLTSARPLCSTDRVLTARRRVSAWFAVERASVMRITVTNAQFSRRTATVARRSVRVAASIREHKRV